MFYKDGLEGSADFILEYDGFGKSAFLKHIIEEGISRHKKKQKPYQLRGNSISGYGIYATANINRGEIIYHGEDRPQRLVSKSHVDQHWDEEAKLNFRRYAYPIGKEVYAIWDEEPAEWSPQNHSCDPNTAFSGLNTIATKDIRTGDELTLDYATFLDHTMEPFECSCGSSACRKIIRGSLQERSITT